MKGAEYGSIEVGILTRAINFAGRPVYERKDEVKDEGRNSRSDEISKAGATT